MIKREEVGGERVASLGRLVESVEESSRRRRAAARESRVSTVLSAPLVVSGAPCGRGG